LALIVCFALSTRLISLIHHRAEPVSLDTEFYFHIAETLRSPFATHAREPFFIWVSWAVIKLFSPEPVWLRVISYVFGIIAVWFTYYVGKRIFNSFIGLSAALLMATNPSLSYMSIRGLRFELQLLVFSGLTACLFLMKKKHPFRSALIYGGLGAVSLLSSLTFLVHYIVIGIIIAVKNKWTWHALIAVIIPLVFILPYLSYCKREFGDPFYALNIHSTYYRNLEFAGEDGFISAEDFSKNPYGGERVSYFRYVFGLHTVPEVIRTSIKGFISVYFGYYTKDIIFGNCMFLFLMYIMGMVTLIARRRYLILVPFFLWGLGLSFVIGSVGLDWRIVVIFAPISYFMAGWGLFQFVELFREGEGNVKQNSQE